MLWMGQNVSAQRSIKSDDWPFGHEGLNLLIQETGIEICNFGKWSALPRDQKFMMILDHPDRAPSYQNVPTFYSSNSRPALGVQFRSLAERGRVNADNTSDYFDSTDCPIVRPVSEHPLYDGVDRIICNRPGFISRITSQFNASDIQRYPPIGRRGLEYRFSAVDEKRQSVAVSDHHLFSNQMLFKGDNLRLAENVLGWLSDDFQRKHVLLMIRGRPVMPIDENDLEIEVPIPTREEVLDALKDLPADKMLEFANSVAAVSEDEQLLNEMAHKLTDNLRPKAVNRILLLATFASCCLFGLVTYFWQRKLLRKTSTDIMARRRRVFGNRDTPSEWSERQAAASLILNAFCLDIANRRLTDWADFPAPLDSSHELVAKRATHEMADAFWTLKTKPNTYWTRERLLELEASTHEWRKIIGTLDPPLAQKINDPL
jgi:hypothetical protein